MAACEVHKPADVAATGQTDAAPPTDGTVLLGGPTTRQAAVDTGFVLLGGPAAAHVRSAKTSEPPPPGADATASGELAQADLADGAAVWGYGAPRIRHTRPAPVVPDSSSDASLSATPVSVPLEGELITPPDMHLDTGAPPSAPSAVALPSGGPRIAGFGRAFCFVLCVLAVATIWRWRRHVLQQDAVTVRAPPPPPTMRPRRRIS